jgi:2-polyprenyl-3-methyl-5-hydroxy-6-metoxy-1,4-benzoquinol methylase
MEAGKHVLRFLKEHKDEAFFLIEVSEALKSEKVSPMDLLKISRKYEIKGMIYLATTWPFGEGYVLTWIDQIKAKNEAIREAKARVTQKKRKLEADVLKTVQYLTPLLEGEPILDVGCGGGRLLVPLIRKGKSVVGLDISRENLHHAKEWANENNVDLHLILGAAEALPFIPNFRGLICFFTLEFTSDPFKAVKEFYRVLEPEGRIVVSLIPVLDDHVRGSSYRRFTGQKSITNSLLPWEAITLLRLAGFSILREEPLQPFNMSPEVKEWLERNPRLVMCMTVLAVYAKKNKTE